MELARVRGQRRRRARRRAVDEAPVPVEPGLVGPRRQHRALHRAAARHVAREAHEREAVAREAVLPAVLRRGLQPKLKIKVDASVR